MINQVSGTDLAQRLAQTPDLQLLDVREWWEVERAKLPGCLHLPLSEFSQWSTQMQELLDPKQPVVVVCHHGVRSAQVCAWLLSQGYPQVENLAGGLDAYALQVDPGLPRY
ncbi:Rhodanese-related sulfurtransferase [Gloeomargarita lithophora Alchichica-D10]|uniref:Rhodanese-related sulfurtransferase n=1 Tax=Gloeomargarita lithophora Alchichica-D10 TaxID=1188229 RepID=A0A1J0AB02_9CYAN|nr:rhodanese-like domain-containing protein [Gloeomargarita lithophora]APB33111.1 Rhodanese-related sulfurtransferase [Gloeomargarita lithophora Alchichica-D10]